VQGAKNLNPPYTSSGDRLARTMVIVNLRCINSLEETTLPVLRFTASTWKEVTTNARPKSPYKCGSIWSTIFSVRRKEFKFGRVCQHLLLSSHAWPRMRNIAKLRKKRLASHASTNSTHVANGPEWNTSCTSSICKFLASGTLGSTAKECWNGEIDPCTSIMSSIVTYLGKLQL
jgi:hypothetical protein